MPALTNPVVKKSAKWGLLGLLALAVASWFFPGYDFTNSQDEDRDLIAALAARVDIGATTQEVDAIIGNGSHRLSVHRMESEWLVASPPRLGATNWNLWIGVREGKVESVRVRLADSKEMHPNDAPADKYK